MRIGLRACLAIVSWGLTTVLMQPSVVAVIAVGVNAALLYSLVTLATKKDQHHA